MTNKNCHKNRRAAEVLWAVFICHKPEAEAFIVFRFNSEILRITILTFKLFFLYSCKRQNYNNTSSHTTSSVRCRSFKNLRQRRTHLRMIQDLPHAFESIAFHFWYRHACVVMYVLFTMWSKWWIDIFVLMMFLRKEDFPCPFFLPTKKGKLGDKFARCLDFQESRADGEFSAVELQMPRSWVGEYVSPFFSEPSTGTSCTVKIWRAASWLPARMAALWTSSVSLDPVLFSGENDDQQGTPLLWPGTQEASICSATKRRATRIGTPSRRLVKMFHPQRSDKSPGSDGSSGTNFVNLKKKSCF